METEPTQQEQIDTQHQPHEHARKRVLVGIGVVVVLTLGIFIWTMWGDTIKETCFGEEVCGVVLPEAQ